MQLHLNGFRGGDPDLHPPLFEPDGPFDDCSTEEHGVVDVLIVGTGPAGLVLGAQLSQFPDISVRLIERDSGPKVIGQADGLSCRSVEMLNAFGTAERLLRESYWANETTYWSEDPAKPGTLTRVGRSPDAWRELSEFPHVLINSARVLYFMLDIMKKSPRRIEPEYATEAVEVTVPEAADDPVLVRVNRTDDNGSVTEELIRARYVIGCDGARSAVRRSINRPLKGDSQNHAWGVLDVLADTDYPDIRRRGVIRTSRGNIGVIPREGGHLVRLYVDLGDVEVGDTGFRSRTTADDVIAAAQRIFAPFRFEVKDVAWWSVYEVGQRAADWFDDTGPDDDAAPRVFIAGDACHTHSAKAGQGMNVSMADAFNLGWKLAAVLRGRSPQTLLSTYSAERQPVAVELIEFDRNQAKLVASRPAETSDDDMLGLRQQLAKSGAYTAGLALHYPASALIGGSAHQDLARGFTIGSRFHSSPATRLADVQEMHLGHVHEADGRWRIYVFADKHHPTDPRSAAGEFCRFLVEDTNSPIRAFTHQEADLDSVFDVRGVFQFPHTELEMHHLPEVLFPRKGKLGLRDYEKAFINRTQDGDIFEERGIDRDRGAVVVVRPDQYVAHVLPLSARSELTEFFGEFMTAVQPSTSR